jgi:hypothetical protein
MKTYTFRGARCLVVLHSYEQLSVFCFEASEDEESNLHTTVKGHHETLALV